MDFKRLRLIPLQEVAKRLGAKPKRDGQRHFRSPCILCRNRNPRALVMNVPEGIWYCHACGEHGDALELVRLVKKLEIKEAAKWLVDNFGSP